MRFAAIVALIVAVSMLSVGCRSTFVPRKQIEAFSQEYQGKRFRAKEDLYFRQNDQVDKNRLVAKKGAVLELSFESSDDWVRVRARDLSTNAEQYPGEVILFLVEEPEKEQTGDQVLSALRQILGTILVPVPEQKSPSGR